MTAKYYVYRNLHRGGFSVKQRGLVVARPKTFAIFDPEFNVSKASQDRARRTGQRNVHAYIMGEDFVVANEMLMNPAATFIHNFSKPRGKLYYNPFTCDTFVDFKTRKPIKNLKEVVFVGDVAYYK